MLQCPFLSIQSWSSPPTLFCPSQSHPSTPHPSCPSPQTWSPQCQCLHPFFSVYSCSMCPALSLNLSLPPRISQSQPPSPYSSWFPSGFLASSFTPWRSCSQESPVSKHLSLLPTSIRFLGTASLYHQFYDAVPPSLFLPQPSFHSHFSSTPCLCHLPSLGTRKEAETRNAREMARMGLAAYFCIKWERRKVKRLAALSAFQERKIVAWGPQIQHGKFLPKD